MAKSYFPHLKEINQRKLPSHNDFYGGSNARGEISVRRRLKEEYGEPCYNSIFIARKLNELGVFSYGSGQILKYVKTHNLGIDACKLHLKEDVKNEVNRIYIKKSDLQEVLEGMGIPCGLRDLEKIM
ncbi:MAG: hypothetical protein AABW50_02595 [Nanoarchaeota archaeon]